MKKELEKYFETLYNNNKITHSYLIANIKLDSIYDDINNILSKYFFNDLTDIYNNADIYVIKPEGSFILKEQIKELQKNIFTTSMSKNIKVYIIDECEKLNQHAANSLLKTLEEPSDNIYAFLITGNINNVISTIKSRCQVIHISSDNEESVPNISEEQKELLKNFVLLLETKKKDAIAYYKDYQKLDKQELTELFTNLLYIYRSSIDYINNKNIDESEIKLIVENNSLKEITNKMLIINDILINLNYNLNINLLLDKFIIDFGGE